jgi:hypothetical protein
MFIPDFRVQAFFKLPANIRLKPVNLAAAVEPGIVPCIPSESRDEKHVEI